MVIVNAMNGVMASSPVLAPSSRIQVPTNCGNVRGGTFKEAARHKDIRTSERDMTAREKRLKALMAKMADRSA